MSKKKITTTDHHIFDKSFCTEKRLKAFLEDKSSFSEEDQKKLKYCIDNYSDCWRIWNKVRWDAAMDSRGVQELKEYLGDKFVPYYDSSWELAKEWATKDRSDKLAVEEFYKNTSNFIYNSVIFYESGHRESFKNSFSQFRNSFAINTVIDFGCGSGNDGLDLLEQGMQVEFVDFNSPSLDFLKWRLKKRKIDKSQYKISCLEDIRNGSLEADMFWSVDVIEHMINPLEIFDLLTSDPKVVAYFTDSDDEAGGRHPFHFRVDNDLLSREFTRREYQKLEHKILSIWTKKSK